MFFVQSNIKINLINPFNTPIRVRVSRVPYHERMEFKKMLDVMLEAGLIQKKRKSVEFTHIVGK